METFRIRDLILSRELGEGAALSLSDASIRSYSWNNQKWLIHDAESQAMARFKAVVFFNGYEDFFCSINEEGSVVYHRSSNLSAPLKLSNTNENAVGIEKFGDSLLLIVSKLASDKIRFYMYSIPDLNNNLTTRVKVFTFIDISDAITNLANFIDKYMVVWGGDAFWLVDVELASCAYSCTLRDGYKAKYSGACLIICGYRKNGHKFEIRELATGNNFRVDLKTQGALFYWEIIGSDLVVGFNENTMVKTNYVTLESKTYNKYHPKTFFRPKSSNDAMVLFDEGRAAFISHLDEYIIIRSSKFTITDANGYVFLLDQLRNLVIIVSINTRQIVNTFNLPIFEDQIKGFGINRDTLEIYIGFSNGNILIMG